MRIAILDDYQQIALTCADWGPVSEFASVEVFSDHVNDEDALAERLLPFDVICAMRERTALTGSLLSRLPNLRLIVTSGMKNAAIDLGAASECGVLVCGTEIDATSTVELTWGLIFALARHFREEFDAMRAGAWQNSVGSDLRGRTLGILGLGRIGSRVASIAHAFSMKTIAWSPHLSAQRCEEVGVERVGKEELFERSDFLTIHLVLSDATRGLIGDELLGRIKPGAFLVNTSRGPIIEEGALLRAVNGDRLGGVALDVFNTEPLPDPHPLRSHPKVIATPHIGYVTHDNYSLFYAQMVEDILAFHGGTPLRVLTGDATKTR